MADIEPAGADERRTPGREAGGRLSGRKLWFQIHKWLGLALLLVLIPLSASGSLLVWHGLTDGITNPQRYAVSNSRATQSASDYAAAARAVLKPDDRIASIEFPAEPGNPVVVTASRAAPSGTAARPGPPPRYQVWLDPATAAVVDHADPANGVLRTLHVFHGGLMIPEVGRKVVGWLGWAMLLSSLTGIWLWWPTTGRLARALRWRRGPLVSGNLHHQVGIWIAIPLAILSFTGAYISFPDFFRSLSGETEQRPAPDRRARPASSPALAPDRAAALAGGSPETLLVLRWPTEKAPAWLVTLRRGGEESQLEVGDADAAVKPAPAPAGGAARFMRQLHDGHSYNFAWQLVIFLAGLAPLVLGVTGAIMWLSTRGWRKRAARRRT